MIDMANTVIPKSDQLNSDDLIAAPRTIRISKISADPGSAEQPILIHFDGDGGKPYKPCKSMRRVLIHVWGRDGLKYVGRSMTLYRDEKVMWGGVAVGGIRISHMSDMEADMTMALTATRSSRKPYTVRPLETQPATPIESDSLQLAKQYLGITTTEQFVKLEEQRKAIWSKANAVEKNVLKQASESAQKHINKPTDPAEGVTI
jgi:hypothetical protein